ncbi:MAG: DUF393 domain-containing protein [Proteobacteria bacterium]|nr:DUF393 domain-containing protein [Pseudomonadota bacterium]
MSVSLGRRLAALPDYSWRRDPSVPTFPDDRPLIVFDGVCVLCSSFARFVAKRDRGRVFQFTAAQAGLGQALYRHLGLDPVDFESNLLLADGRVLAKLEAFAGIMGRLPPPWVWLAAAGSLPAAVGEPLYDLVARNRYSLFGKRDQCVRPDASWAGRVIE